MSKNISATRNIIQRGHKLYGPTAKVRAIILGCGATGSIVAENLARIGVNRFILVDFDSVEIENIGQQRFKFNQIGEFKVHALAANLKEINPDIKVQTYAQRIEEIDWNKIPKIQSVQNAVFCLVDSMEARRYAYDLFKHDPSIFIETRTSPEYFEILSAHRFMDNKVSFDKLWFEDKKAAPFPCGERSTAYVNEICGAMAVQRFNFLLRANDPIEGIDVMCFDVPNNIIFKDALKVV